MSRADRRLPGDFREISLSTGNLLTVQGSSCMKYGNTHVICAAVGPKESRLGRIDTDLLEVKVKTYPEVNWLNRMVITAVTNAVNREAYRDSYIELNITILCDDGALPCCAINAAIAAVKDVGLELKHDVAASAFVVRGGTLLIDPSKQEEETADGVATFVFRKDSKEIFSCFFDGAIQPEIMVALMENACCVPDTLL